MSVDNHERPSSDDDALAPLVARLRAESGFASRAVEPARLAAHLRARAVARGVAGAPDGGLEAMLRVLEADRDEFAAIESIFSPPETWLFRYPESFEFARDHACELARARGFPGAANRASPAIRALIVGAGGWCEPCSLAAALREGVRRAGCEATVSIEASDRAQSVFAAAPEFRDMQVRAGIPAWARPHFEQHGDMFRALDATRAVISTRVADELRTLADAAASGGAWDLVFFRNVAIYLDDARRARAFRALSSLLSPEGALFVGHSEVHLAAQETGLVPASRASSFALVAPALRAGARNAEIPRETERPDRTGDRPVGQARVVARAAWTPPSPRGLRHDAAQDLLNDSQNGSRNDVGNDLGNDPRQNARHSPRDGTGHGTGHSAGQHAWQASERASPQDSGRDSNDDLRTGAGADSKSGATPDAGRGAAGGSHPPQAPAQVLRGETTDPAGSAASPRVASPVSSPVSSDVSPPAFPPTAVEFVARARECLAKGDDAGAAQAVSRALYLDLRHEEALLLAAELADRRGSRAEAARLRDRALRAHLAGEEARERGERGDARRQDPHGAEGRWVGDGA